MGKWKFTAQVTSPEGKSGTGSGVAVGTREQAEAAVKRQVAEDGHTAGRIELEEQDR